MTTVSTPVKDLQANDLVLYYGSVFQVTSPVRWFNHSNGVMVPVADCKRIETIDYCSSIDGILKGYDAFQGLWNVAKIIK